MGFLFHCKFYNNNLYSVIYKIFAKHKYIMKKITVQATDMPIRINMSYHIIILLLTFILLLTLSHYSFKHRTSPNIYKLIQ